MAGLMYLSAPEQLVANMTTGHNLHVTPLLGGGTSGAAVSGTF